MAKHRVNPLLDSVPHYDSFLTMDELDAALDEAADVYSGLARVHDIGKSRDGTRLRMLSVGSATRHVLVLGGPHPNEPVGGLSCLHLIRTVCENEWLRDGLRLSWHFIPNVDPDGARLNESWFPTPADRHAYTVGFYRPAMTEQVEWTFPYDAGDVSFASPLPETRALMAVIDELRPSLLYSLHNADSGGAFFYLSHYMPDLAGELRDLTLHVGLPIDVGLADEPDAEAIGPGVFLIPPAIDMARELLEAGRDLVTHPLGASSADYAARYGTLSLVTEVPCWSDPRSTDESISTVPFRVATERAGRESLEAASLVRGALSRTPWSTSVDNPFRRAVQAMVDEIDANVVWAAKAASLHRSHATVAEVASIELRTQMFRLRSASMLVRALQREIDASDTVTGLEALRDEWAARLELWFGQAEHSGCLGVPLELRSLVQVQVGAILVAALSLDDAS